MDKISKKEAEAAGMDFYFTGKPCKNGGIAPRRTSNYQCTCETCKSMDIERTKRYVEENKERVAEYKKKWAEENQEHLKYRMAQYYRDNEDVIKERSRRRRVEKPEECREADRDWYERNREYALEKAKEYRESIKGTEDFKMKRRDWYERNKDRVAEKNRIWRIENAERYLETAAKWREENRELVREYQARRRAAKRNAMPSWYGELDEFVIQEAYELLPRREAATGIKWHVDHMIPLQADWATGFHCAYNIQVIPASMNMSKGNRKKYTEELEWLEDI